MKYIDKAVLRMSQALNVISVIAVAGLMLLVVFDVFMRYAFNKPTPGSNELVGLFMAMAVFFSFAYAQKKMALVYVTFFMRKLPGKLPMVMWALTGWMSAFISVLLTIASFVQTGNVIAQTQTTATLYIPLTPFYFAMGIGFIGFTLVIIYDAVRSTMALFNPEIEKEVEATWPT